MSMMRLDHYLVTYTAYTRREIYQHLQQGDIFHNNRRCETVRSPVTPGDSIIIGTDLITVSRPSTPVLYAYHKPKGIISTRRDPKGRRCLDTVCNRCPEPVFPVGRLDRESTGLLLLTNDGQLANQLLHPRYATQKVYTVTLNKALTPAHRAQLVNGLFLSDGPVAFTDIVRLGASQPSPASTYSITLTMGRNRIIRRAVTALGYTVTALQRTAIGSIKLGSLAPNKLLKLDYTNHMT